VELKKTKLLGGAGKGEMDLPVVIFQGTGDNRNKEFTAGLGDWIAELRGNFRVFKKAQFKATFEPAKADGDEQIIKATQTLLDVGMLKLQDEPSVDETHEDDRITCDNPDCGPCRSGDENVAPLEPQGEVQLNGQTYTQLA
jgi:hypothetical protein